MADAWSREENEAIVADYLAMLELELAGIPFNKAERNRQLQKILNHRNNSSVELKHQNISAALITLGYPYVDGYKPRFRRSRMKVQSGKRTSNGCRRRYSVRLRHDTVLRTNWLR